MYRIYSPRPNRIYSNIAMEDTILNDFKDFSEICMQLHRLHIGMKSTGLLAYDIVIYFLLFISPSTTPSNLFALIVTEVTFQKW